MPEISWNDLRYILAVGRTSGAGRSLLPCAIGDQQKGIARLSGPVLDRELWLLVHPELRNFARIRAVVEWLDALVEEFTISARR
jgi:hypothetical protein